MKKGLYATWLLRSASFAVVGTALAVALAGPLQAQVQERSYRFAIGPTDLGKALKDYGRATHRQLIFTNDLVVGKTSPAVRGTLPADQALRLLLSGSGLAYRLTSAGVVMIVRAEATPVAAVQTATIRNAPAEEPVATDAAPISDIVVTGTQIRRAGYNEPTPTTVVTAQDIRASAPALLADYLNQQPALLGSYGTRVLGLSTGPNSGANILNLRNLGPTRTLVLLDGRRVTPTLATGQVDVNLLPQGLVKRVDIVTGGASADWGSDAVAGVVNFVLDTRFTGLKFTAQGGITGKGDGRNYQIGGTYGAEFAGGRGHFLVDAQTNYAGAGDPVTSRSWFNSTKVIANPAYTATNGQARNIVVSGVGLSQATQGGLITSGVLRGTQFIGPNGTPTAFNFGTVSGLYSYGGSAADYGSVSPLQNPVRVSSGFSRLSYDLTPDITAYGEFAIARSTTKLDAIGYTRLANVNISNDNAFLDPALRARLGGAGFVLGTTNQNLGMVQLGIRRTMTRATFGLDGRLGHGWSWNIYGQHGVTRFRQTYSNDPIVANYNLAVDAVRDPVTGALVCRSTLTNPSNGCVPLNLFGIQTPTAAQSRYLTGSSIANIDFSQDVIAATLRGDPFAIWAGPVSVATGVEYRRDTFTTSSDALSQSVAFYVGNAQPGRGAIVVKEGFFSAVAPLIKNAPLIRSIEASGAVRVTNYSTSGTVTTWKGGLTWQVDDALRFRATRSRDIRAGNQAEVFTAQSFGVQSVSDPVTNSAYIVSLVTQGNRSVQPERGDTFTVGGVYQPHWFPGFSASVDYYKIKVQGAIVTPTAQQTVDSCQLGNGSVCSSIIRDPGSNLITRILVQAQNVNREAESGIDFEASYRLKARNLLSSLDGDLSFRLLANYVQSRTLTAFGTEVEYAGTNADSNNKGTAVPHWRGNFRASYSDEQFTGTVTGRFIGAGRISNVPGLVAYGKIPAIAYVDLQAAYRPNAFHNQIEFFVVVENLFDRDPPAAPTLGSSSILSTGTNGFLYDILGRQFRGGIRVQF
jgi:iron complex outermembrane receptor protein